MNTDPIADYLTRIRNASAAKLKTVEIPASNVKKAITQILFDQGYITDFKFEDDNKQGTIKIALKYNWNRTYRHYCNKRKNTKIGFFVSFLKFTNPG